MPEIHFVKNIPVIETDNETPLMKSLLKADLPVASSCNGDGICSKCKVQVIEGAENLSIETELEKRLRQRNRIPDGYRISCQTKVLGKVKIDTGYW